MAIFNSFLYVYQAGYSLNIPTSKNLVYEPPYHVRHLVIGVVDQPPQISGEPWWAVASQLHKVRLPRTVASGYVKIAIEAMAHWNTWFTLWWTNIAMENHHF